MNTKPNIVKLLVLIGIGIVLLIGIGYFISLKMPQQNQYQQNSQESKIDHQTGSLIPNFPSFPLYPGASIGTSQHVQGEKSYQVDLNTKDKVETIMSWYKRQLISSGWQLDRDVDPHTPTDQNIVVSKSGMRATVNAEAEEDGTDIVVHIETL